MGYAFEQCSFTNANEESVLRYDYMVCNNTGLPALHKSMTGASRLVRRASVDHRLRTGAKVAPVSSGM